MSYKSLLPILFILIASSCRKDQSVLKSEGTLNFSSTTIYFDTVFTRLPGSPYPRSVNKQFLVRNPYKEMVNVNVRLCGGNASQFRINVDGKSGILSTLEILPKDSAWVFVEATLEPNFGNDPLVKDSIEFETNGHKQFVHLAAYGWDAYYFKDTVFETSTNWTLTDKPYVIVNTCFVDVDQTLTIGPGIHVYSTTNSYLVDTNNVKYGYHALNVLGTLKVNGTKTNPVIFEGDRLGFKYTDVPGQWQGLGFYRTSKDNEITHAIIKNATYGIRVDSLSNNANPKLVIKNTIIKNMSGLGIWGRTGEIYAENTVISNCAIAWFYAQLGGRYDFFHCSMSNTSAASKDPHLILSNQLRDENKVVIKTYDITCTLANSIIYGPNEKEIGRDIGGINKDTVIIDYCLLKYTPPFGLNNIYNVDPQFEDAGKSILRIKSGSPAKDKGINGLIDYKGQPIISDLEEKPRNVGNPDMGAYEVQ